jgi:neutral ceramidase
MGLGILNQATDFKAAIMNKNMRLLLVTAILLATMPRLVAGQQAGLQAGTAAVEITPDVFPMQLRSGASSHVHDPLHVRAVALQHGEGRVVIALVDALGVGREWTDEAKAIAAERTGWKPEEMLVCATHTHSAPSAGDTSPGRIAYQQRRQQGLVEALTQAIQSLEPARVGFASDQEAGEVYNRRWFLKEGTMQQNPLGGFDQVRTNPPRQNIVKPAGPTDPELCVVDVRTRRGRPLALIANYALHYVGGIPQVVEPDGRTVGMASADYFGEFSRVMPYRIGGSKPPESLVAMMTNGASGDINNIDFDGRRPPRAPFEQARLVAAKTADAAWRAVRKIERYDDHPTIAILQREVTIRYRKPTEEQIQQARRIMELPRQEREAIHQRSSSVAAAILRYAEPDMTPSEDVIVQAIRIGDQAIVSMPFEVLVEIGLEIKEKSPFPHTFLISLANGSYGYLPPPHQHQLGGYETWPGTSRFEKTTSVVLTKHLLEMLDELKGA